MAVRDRVIIGLEGHGSVKTRWMNAAAKRRNEEIQRDIKFRDC